MNSDPTAIRLDVAENRLAITWADGHESTYDGAYLRYTCPCALCRGHSPGEIEPPSWVSVKDVRVTHTEGVGSYALGFTFTDDHGSGVYSFEHLREVCPANRPGVDATGRPLPAGEMERGG